MDPLYLGFSFMQYAQGEPIGKNYQKELQKYLLDTENFRVLQVLRQTKAEARFDLVFQNRAVEFKTGHLRFLYGALGGTERLTSGPRRELYNILYQLLASQKEYARLMGKEQ